MRGSYEVVIVGAGAAGLAGARRLMAAHRDVLVLEACAREELARLVGADVAKKLKPVASSHWQGDPYIRGAYSHAMIGHADARQTLAAPVADRLYFSGEA